MSKLVLMLLTTLILVGCGNKGSLYFPEQMPEQASSNKTVSPSAKD